MMTQQGMDCLVIAEPINGWFTNCTDMDFKSFVEQTIIGWVYISC